MSLILLLTICSIVWLQPCLATLPFGSAVGDGTVLYLNGFHFVSGNSSEEVSADHYCTLMSAEMLQCVVYSTNKTPSRLAAIEYIITGDAFKTLPAEERQLWHSHRYEASR